MKWNITHSNDAGRNDESFSEWWEVTDGEQTAKCYDEGFAKWLCETLNASSPVIKNTFPLPEVAIAVLDKGFVYAGFVHFSECGQYLTIRNACCVRRWSVERGLGKVASEGPDKDTVLNDGPDIFVPSHALIHLLAINRAAWARFKE